MSNDNKTIYSSAVIDFITVAAEYCVSLEKQEPVARKEFLEKTTKLLPLIYVKASLLPKIEEDEDTLLQDYVSEEDYNFVQNKVWSILKDKDEYLEVFSPELQFSEAPVVATISENLADIYQDLKNFIAVYADRNEECMQAALFKVQDNFKTYWGQKLVNAMRPLHETLYGDTSEEQEDF